MIDLNNTPNLPPTHKKAQNVAVDEFMHQILHLCCNYSENGLQATPRNPIFRNTKTIHNLDDSAFGDYINSNSTEVLVSFDRDYTQDEGRQCGSNVRAEYNIYVRISKDGIQSNGTDLVWNAKTRLTQIIDTLQYLLTTIEDPIHSIINIDSNNTDPEAGLKFTTNLFKNSVIAGSRFEALPEEYNDKVFLVGGFTYRAYIAWTY